MKILHLCLSCFYIDHMNYQENALARQNKIDGNEVLIIASTEIFGGDYNYRYIKPCQYINEDNIPVIRIAYKNILNQSITRKIRLYKGLYDLVEKFNPDVILFHGLASLELHTLVKYKKSHPAVKIYLDSHEDYYNSGTNFVSKFILHRFFYRRSLKHTLPHIEKIFYITAETKDYILREYKIPSEKTQYYPLGGHIIEDEQKGAIKKEIRQQLNISEEDILFIMSGKMNSVKCSLDVLTAFKLSEGCSNVKLLVVGEFSEDIKERALDIIRASSNIIFLGWKKGSEMQLYLIASDIHIQLFGQSATLQNALCSHCTAAIYPHESHVLLLGDAAFYIQNQMNIVELIHRISDNPDIAREKQSMSFECAKAKLDYKQLSSELYK